MCCRFTGSRSRCWRSIAISRPMRAAISPTPGGAGRAELVVDLLHGVLRAVRGDLRRLASWCAGGAGGPPVSGSSFGRRPRWCCSRRRRSYCRTSTCNNGWASCGRPPKSCSTPPRWITMARARWLLASARSGCRRRDRRIGVHVHLRWVITLSLVLVSSFWLSLGPSPVPRRGPGGALALSVALRVVPGYQGLRVPARFAAAFRSFSESSAVLAARCSSAAGLGLCGRQWFPWSSSWASGQSRISCR